MQEGVATDPIRGLSPRAVARGIGILTLLTVVGGIFGQEYVAGRLIVWRDATATATNILAHQNLYLSAVAVYLVEMGMSVATTALFYVLLKPAGRSLSMTALCIGLTANILKAGGRVLFAAPVYVLGATRFHALSAGTLNDLSLLLLMIGDHAAGIAMGFFGFQSLLRGCLILKSTFLPKFLAVLALVGGVAWLTYLWPPLGYRLGDISLLIGVLGVFVEMFWLIVFGVKEQRWHEQARANRL